LLALLLLVLITWQWVLGVFPQQAPVSFTLEPTAQAQPLPLYSEQPHQHLALFIG
jgi:hypothetical protein